MHPSFTGSSRKIRQVNLSGRNPNPWAGLAVSQKHPAGASSSAPSTLALAHAERRKRQHDRDSLNASRTIQRIWRGHASREKTRAQWRSEWDAYERARWARLTNDNSRLGGVVPSKRTQGPQSAISLNHGPHFGEAYSTSSDPRLLDSPSEIWNNSGFGLTTLPYATAEQCFAQLRLLVHFIDVKLETDRMRLLFFGHNLNETLHTLPSIATGDLWTLELARLGRLTLDLMQVLINHQQGEIHYDGLHDGLHDQLEQPLNLLILLTNLTPREIALHAQQYYHVLAEIIRKWGSNIPPATRELTLEALQVLLKPIGSSTVTVYGTMAMQLLTVENLTNWTDFERFCSTFNHKLLAKSLSHILERQGQWRHWSPTNTPERHTSEREGPLWLLAHFIYIHRRAEGQEMSVAEETDFIRVVAAFLDYLGDDIIARSDLQNNAGKSSGAPSPLSPGLASSGPLPQFVREQIDSLRRQQSITSILSYMGGSPATSNPESEEASLSKVLAGYALTLLRVFPAKADEIRMWLYRGSSDMKRSSGSSAIEYFWYASRNSTLFKNISRSYKSVPTLLKGPRDQTDQIGRPQPSAQDIDAWSQEWNVILLFLELYTFVLKFMDDEEFLSGDKPPTNGVSPRRIEPVRDGVLPIREIADMTVFLKNLAFALYWNASEFTESSEQTDNDAISTILRISPSSNPTFSNSKKLHREGQLSTPRLPLQHLKGLVTGLLRMLHERDSRRTIFSKDHWLMTSQLDLMGFIPAVVAEEERRNEIHEDSDEEEEDIDDFVENSDLLNNATGWSRPNLLRTHMQGSFISANHVAQQARKNEMMRKIQERAKKRRQIELLAPRLEILRNLPFFIPFETRVQIFREFVHRDQRRRRNGFVDADLWRMSIVHESQGRAPDGRPSFRDVLDRHHAEIRRTSIFEDAFDSFYKLGEELKEPIQISFIDKFGTVEAGIDGGGVTKEFLTSVTNEAFDPEASHRMFVENDQHSLYPDPTAFESAVETLKRLGFREGTEDFNEHLRELLRRYEFLGRIIGKCLYEGILIDVSFAGFFLLKWALTGGTSLASNESAYRASINDLRDLDEELYQGLLKLKNYAGDVESDFSLNFTISDSIPVQDSNGVESFHTITRDLKPGGVDIPVTNANRLTYILLVAQYRLQRQPQLVTNHFLKGLGQIIQPMWLAMFNQRELQTLVGGDTSEVDIADLRRNTQYSGIYAIGDDEQEHYTIAMFWQVLKEMDDSDRRKVLKFVTSTPRAPLLGFSHLNPRFSIRDSGMDQVRLPSTSTCVNLLKLPIYADAKTLREKLLYAVNSGAGFDLS